MQVGSLVTWKLDVVSDKAPLEYGVVIGHFNGKSRGRKQACVWVKFASGQHAHRERTLCAIAQLVLVEDIKQKRRS
tara:strand:- start:211 stop:438 length:228 start_codon:yes stop_codon:yes gene_type:complete